MHHVEQTVFVLFKTVTYCIASGIFGHPHRLQKQAQRFSGKGVRGHDLVGLGTESGPEGDLSSSTMLCLEAVLHAPPVQHHKALLGGLQMASWTCAELTTKA